MTRFAAGEDEAFADVYQLAARRIYGFAWSLCRDASSAEDLMQDTFLRLYRARARYRASSPVLPWACTIARHLFLDGSRSRQLEARARGDDARERVRHELHGEDLLGIAPDEALARAELKQWLERAIAALPERQAFAIRLLKLDDVSLSDAAALLGVSTGAIKLRAHRGYEALRLLLSDGSESSDRA